jgi:thiamine pyrophosphokinase
MKTVIFAGGTLRSGQAVTTAITTAELIIAADNGAKTALQYGCIPSFIVGDFDSLEGSLQNLQAQGSQIVRAAVEKDETDTELAIQCALEHGASSITLLGALGGERFEHTIANVLLLADFFEKVPIRIVDGPSICWLLRGPGSSTIQGRTGDQLSLFPLTISATGIHTSNLYYPLKGETLYFGKSRGISNVLTHESAGVRLEEGLLLIIHTTRIETR